MFERFLEPLIDTCFAFSVEGTGGNPAAVMVSKTESTQAISLAKTTASLRGMETTLVVPSSQANHLAKLRFFVPNAEMAMCGHGTLAAVAKLHQLGMASLGDHSVETQAAVFALQVGEKDGHTAVDMLTTDNKITHVLQRQDIQELDRISGLEIADTVAVFLGGNVRPKTYIEVTDGCLDHIQPTSSQVQSICDAHATTGIYIFSQRASPSYNHIEARHFPCGGGLYEDAATGVAAGGLACYLTGRLQDLDTFKIYQGRAMGNCSRLNVRRGDGPGEWWVGGMVRQACDALIAPVMLDKVILDTMRGVTGEEPPRLEDDATLVSILGLSSMQIALLLSEIGDALTLNLFETPRFLQGRIRTLGDIKAAVRETWER